MHNLKTDSDFSFKKENRIKSKNAFQIVYKTGRSVVDSMSVMYVLAKRLRISIRKEYDEKNIKIGFAVGKKMGNAVVRNRVKRLMREVFRHRRSELKDSIHIIWVARKKLIAADIYTYDRIFMRLAKRAGILK